MPRENNSSLLLPFLLVCLGCQNAVKQVEPNPGTYAYDNVFLKKNNIKIIELADHEGKAKVILSPAHQGRVMTSTANGDKGSSYGWINYELISSGEKKKQFNPVGGEERFWLGPEGGQYSLYFAPGDSFHIRHWLVPPIIDTVTYHFDQSNPKEVTFSKEASLTNYSGTVFNIFIERKIRLLAQEELESRLKTPIPDQINFVGYETDNRIRNDGPSDWKKENGLISIWLLGMFTPSDHTSVIIPFYPKENASSLITSYFGKIPIDRLTMKDSILFFTCDGKYRSKLGLPPSIAKPIAGSFDFQKNILTIVLLTVDQVGDYVNSKWEIQQEPYRGDVVNSYNDGPLEDGGQLGPFYEIESSSSVLELKKGESQSYRQITSHFEGHYPSLQLLAKNLLGVELDELKD